MTLNTRYNIGDTVWFLYDHAIRSAHIVGIEVQQCGTAPQTTQYRFAVYPVQQERHCFPDKKSIIDTLSNI